MSGLILLDWDNTIVGEQVNVNSQQLQQAIQSKIGQGWQIGLNSDTPLRRLQGWWKALGMNGPIVAERGAVIWHPNTQPVILSSTQELFADLKLRIIQEVSKFDGYSLYHGDSTNFVHSVSGFDINDNVLIALDAYRICSLGLFIRRIHSGKLLSDISTAENFYDLLQANYLLESGIYSIDFNPAHCYLCLNALDANKSIGVKTLLEKVKSSYEIYMIGDSMADFVDLPYVSQLAVGNASQEYKSVSTKIARKKFAEGCAELINSI